MEEKQPMQADMNIMVGNLRVSKKAEAAGVTNMEVTSPIPTVCKEITIVREINPNKIIRNKSGFNRNVIARIGSKVTINNGRYKKNNEIRMKTAMMDMKIKFDGETPKTFPNKI